MALQGARYMILNLIPIIFCVSSVLGKDFLYKDYEAIRKELVKGKHHYACSLYYWFGIIFPEPELNLAQKITSVIQSYEKHVKRNCVVFSLKSKLPLEIYEDIPIVRMTNPEEDLELWMREDRHGTHFDTGCTVIVTHSDSLDRKMENKFKNLLWLVLDQLPKKKDLVQLQVDYPVIELYPKIISARCPYLETPKVSFYTR